MKIELTGDSATSDEWLNGNMPAIFTLEEFLRFAKKFVEFGMQEYVVATCKKVSEPCRHGGFSIAVEITLAPKCMIGDIALKNNISFITQQALEATKLIKPDNDSKDDYDRWLRTA